MGRADKGVPEDYPGLAVYKYKYYGIMAISKVCLRKLENRIEGE